MNVNINKLFHLQKPRALHCYVIKHQHTNSMYSIAQDDGKRMLVAFRLKEQAKTMSRLMNDMKHSKHRLVIDKHRVDSLKGICQSTSLDLMIVDANSSYEVFPAIHDAGSQDFRFFLENKFKYGC